MREHDNKLSKLKKNAIAIGGVKSFCCQYFNWGISFLILGDGDMIISSYLCPVYIFKKYTGA